MTFRLPALALTLTATLISGCAKDNDFDSTGGINVVRSSCPAVAVPTYTGDITLFDPPASLAASAIDVVATITNVRSTCTDSGADVVASATFDVFARRTNPSGARDVILPYFGTVVQGGRVVRSKSVSRVAIHFDDGALRGSGRGSASANVNRSAITLPLDIQKRINKKRRAGEEDAAIDPMSNPTIKAAVERASFELLIGFNLSETQLQYNATR